MTAHVFNVPQPYRSKEPPAVEKPRSKFRWFGQSLRLGRSSSAAAAAASSADAVAASRRTKSSYISSDSARESPAASPQSISFTGSALRFSAKSLDDDDPTDSVSALKFGLFKRTLPSPSSLRSSIASTASSSTASDDLSPPSSSSSSTRSSTLSTTSSADEELRSPRMEFETQEVLRDVMGTDATWLSDDHVVSHYAQLNWRIVRIQADGNCLFRAISDQIYRNEAFYGDIRRRVVEYIERERKLFQPFVEDEQKGLHEPISEYCTRMKLDAQWGGNPELYAAARLFNVHIVVHQGPARRLRIENGNADAPAMALHLLFRNDHYDSLHDESQLEDKPRLSTTVAITLEDAVDAADNQTIEGEEVEPVQQEEPKTEKKKKRKGVVFIGEQTRVERVVVEPPQLPVVRVPVRAVVRSGKVCSVTAVDEEDNQENESLLTLSICDSEECAQQDPLPVPEDNQDSELRVAKVKRVNFRRGRRVA